MKRIFHLDAGRKFFTADVICELLDTMSRTGFTDLEYYFLDNQGFRFALEDMTLSTAFGTYDLRRCLGDGFCQEDKAPDGTNGYLTEADLERILAHAKSLGIGVIPALEMPGHMGAILQHYPELLFPGSRSSIDLRKEAPVAFAYALAEKYGAFFAAHGCTYFNFCADEFANDLGTMGFDRIYEDGTMADFVRFVNGLCGVLKPLGLTPMAFNDGFYYKDDTTRYGRIDPSVEILYWSHGWNTYFPASPLTLQEQGFRVYNAHQFYYCGAGCDWPERIGRLEKYDPYVFDGNISVSDPAGVVLCVWCDKAYADGPDGGVYVAGQTAKAMEVCRDTWDRLIK